MNCKYFDVHALAVVLVGFSSYFIFFSFFIVCFYLFSTFFSTLAICHHCVHRSTGDFRVFIHLYRACHLFLFFFFFINHDRFVVHFQWQMLKFDFFAKWRDPNKSYFKRIVRVSIAKFRFEQLVWAYDMFWYSLYLT